MLVPPLSKEDFEASSELRMRADAELLKLLFKHGPIVFLANLSAGVTLVAGLWAVAPLGPLMVWLGLMLSFNLVRSIAGRRFARVPISENSFSHWDRIFLASAFVSGTFWGSTAVFLYLPGEPTHSMFLAVVVIGMTAASGSLLSFHRLAYPVFALPAIVPLAVRLLAEDLPTHFAIGMILPVYFTLLYLLSREIHRFTSEAVCERLLREQHALLDQVTGIPNRRSFEEFLRKEWLRATRSGKPISLIIADIDDFKRCNDRFGHPVGDVVLRAVAGLFARTTRRGSDIAARIGGEEFALVAPETDRTGALAIARKLQAALETMPQGTLAPTLRPTLSIGICTTLPSAGSDAGSLFRDADSAMYVSKEKGKNRITICPASADTEELGAEAPSAPGPAVRGDLVQSDPG